MSAIDYLASFIGYVAIGSTVAAAIGWALYAAWEALHRS